ncbi:hypothetical protein [Paenibacillus dakarensis]|uniref:hypothetical protein n=1 Tax=Paenibacillus dakarensis TaxID=1527293 RepID=UPI0006D57781|nr:hypothetical protein [Paenibacillus dakarensis]
MRIQGKTWRIVTHNPYKTEDVPIDLYLLAICDGNGDISDYVSSGRPRTYRVYGSLEECRNGIRACKRKYKGTLRPVRILTGEFIEEAK